MLSTCAAASTTVAATTELALNRAFFSACHAFFAAERLEGAGIFRRGNHRVYLPLKDPTNMRSRAAVDMGERLVTWQRAARAAFAGASRQAFSADPPALRKPLRLKCHARGGLFRCGGAHRAALRRRRWPERAVRALSDDPRSVVFLVPTKCLSCMKWAFAPQWECI